ncbi:hypothetical protein C2S52_001470 [Perilla frutescens var. hirtella]|nr:hypothetical protein C2S52_001470 [Perilla frutescens var. hirtella]
MLEIWGRPSILPRIHLNFDRFGRPVGPNQSKFCEFLGTIARNGMYCPHDVEDWHKMPIEYKRKMLHVVKSRYDTSLGDEGWILTSINKKWRSWKSNLKVRYFIPDKDVEVLIDERDGRVLLDQWANILSYWNRDEVQARSEKNTNARSKRMMNHLTGKRSFAQVQDKLAKEKGHSPSRAEMLDACYTSKGNTPFIVFKYLEEIEELRNKLPEGSKDPVGPNDLYAQVCGQDKPGRVRMFGEGVSPSYVWREVPNRNMCKRIMLEQRSEIVKMNNKIAELQSQVCTQQRSVSESSPSITPLSNNLPRLNLRKQPLQVGARVTLKSIFDQSKVVAEGCLHSIDPNVEVGGQLLGEKWCEVHVKVALQPEEPLIRPYDYCQTVQDAPGQMVAWPCNLVIPIGWQ